MWSCLRWTGRVSILAVCVGAPPVFGETPHPHARITVQNPGFENQFEGWYREGWHLDDVQATATIDEVVRHDGTRAVKLAHHEPNDTALVQSIKVTPSTVYRISGWIKTEEVVVHESGNIGAALGVSNTAVHSDDVQGTRSWQSRELWVRTAPHQTRLGLTCRLGHWSSTATGTAWFDDVGIEQSPELRAGVMVHNLVGRAPSSRTYWLAVVGLGMVILGLEWWVRVLRSRYGVR